MQIMIALCFYATDTFQRVTIDSFGVSQRVELTGNFTKSVGI